MYRQNMRIMVRFSPLFAILVFTVCSVQGSGGKELPVPISDVLERLVDLEKRLLIQEKKNVDLEKRLLEQENLNKAQEKIIENMSSCDFTPKGKGRPYVVADRYNSTYYQFALFNAHNKTYLCLNKYKLINDSIFLFNFNSVLNRIPPMARVLRENIPAFKVR